MEKPTLYYPGIQALRGLAALSVMLHHFHVMVAKEKYYDISLWNGWVEGGYRGVDLFFVISGFIMMMLATRDAERPARFGYFIRSRIIRIYAPYLAAFGGLSFAYFLLPGITQGGYAFEIGLFLKNIFLIPRDDITSYVPVVAWTLSYEMLFYLIFSLIFLLHKRIFFVLFSIWQATCFYSLLNGGALNGTVSILLDHFNLAFGAGMASFWLHERYGHISKKLPFLLAIALYGALLFCDHERLSSTVYELGVLVCFGLFIAGFAQHKMKLLEWFGNISYSLYLVHYPVIALTFIMIFKLGLNDALPPSIAVFIAFIVATVAARIFWWMFEKHACNWLRSIFIRA